jgi:ketosteroid isomerase-like protein
VSADNVEVLRRAIAAFNRHDVQELEGLVSADVEIVPLRAVLEDTAYHGRDAVAAFVADSDESWETIRYEIENIDDVGDVLVVSARLRGRGRASGADVDAEVTSIAHFEDGKIESLRSFEDRAKALAAAGLEPQADRRNVG